MLNFKYKNYIINITRLTNSYCIIIQNLKNEFIDRDGFKTGSQIGRFAYEPNNTIDWKDYHSRSGNAILDTDLTNHIDKILFKIIKTKVFL